MQHNHKQIQIQPRMGLNRVCPALQRGDYKKKQCKNYKKNYKQIQIPTPNGVERRLPRVATRGLWKNIKKTFCALRTPRFTWGYFC